MWVEYIVPTTSHIQLSARWVVIIDISYLFIIVLIVEDVDGLIWMWV